MRPQFEKEAKRWRANHDEGDEAVACRNLASRWQQWSQENEVGSWPDAKGVHVRERERKQQGNWWYNEGNPPRQATISLIRRATNMVSISDVVTTHPVAFGTDGVSNLLVLDGKVNPLSGAECHESVCNLKLTTCLAFNVTVGYPRFKDKSEETHAWVAFGLDCTRTCLLNLVGYKCFCKCDNAIGPSFRANVPQGSPAPLAETEVGESDEPPAQGEQDQPLAGRAEEPLMQGASPAPLAQPLAGEAEEPTARRPAVGE
jgi:hypothetical protein